ncbi:MAG: hypothetical protein JXR37_09880 [Kiritimatiellae bacterium]|nr:hypothetical protein [Kiritimatiellia bacterium]
MNGVRKIAIAAGLCGALLGTAARTDGAEAEFGADATNRTVITSDRLVFDYQGRQAVFEGNVLVEDPQMRVKADTLTVVFLEQNQIKTITAEGHVRLHQADMVALGQKAVYEVPEGRLVLTGEPRIRRGNDVLSGETITFLRAENKVICEPNARLIVYPGEMGSLDDLFKD